MNNKSDFYGWQGDQDKSRNGAWIGILGRGKRFRPNVLCNFGFGSPGSMNLHQTKRFYLEKFLNNPGLNTYD
jgi:hypothetical protein